jgi:hypothetical protein
VQVSLECRQHFRCYLATLSGGVALFGSLECMGGGRGGGASLGVIGAIVVHVACSMGLSI